MHKSQLNQPQIKAVRHIDSPLLVLAGAGSGKTRVITEKIAYLINECELKANGIFAVTFTNKAAKEMQERVQKAIAKVNLQGIKISTFHTLGLNILKKHGKLYGLRPNFSIYDYDDSLKLISEMLSSDKEEAQLYLHQISTWKNHYLLPHELEGRLDSEFQANVLVLYKLYQEQLIAYNAVDFDDLIYAPLYILSHIPEAENYWQNRISYLLVDEYQDTNIAQYQLIKRLVAGRKAFTVVGDDDQSIYAWRGAKPENLVRLKEDYHNLEIIKLEQNYRSTSLILRAANEIISHNPHIFEKKLWSQLGEGDAIHINECKDPEDEAERIAFAIRQHALLNHRKFSQYAILYRGNHQARIFELALRRQQVPYRLIGGTSFFQQAEVKDLLAYLRLLVNPEDTSSLLRIINIPKREIGPAALKKIADFANEHNLSLMAAMRHEHIHSHIGKASDAKLRQFCRTIQDLQKSVDIISHAQLFDLLLEGTNYLGYLKEQTANKASVEKRINNCNYLGEWLQRSGGVTLEDSVEPEDINPNRNLSDVLSHLTLVAMLDNQEDKDEQQEITLMTLHTSKGLEFPYVYLAGIEEDILPHKNSIDNDTVEEERRLFYVGITRAQKNLTISYCQKRKRYGNWEFCKPSRFLDELPADDLEWHKLNTHKTPELKAQVGRSALDAIRASLKKN